MIWVFDFIVYALLDLGSSYLLYVAMNFYAIPEQLSKPLNVPTPIGESILEEGVYHDCPVFMNHKSTMTDLVELDMVQFDVIFGMDWLHIYYATIYFSTRVVKFQFPMKQLKVEK